nr:calcium-binding protein [Conexibacter sp. W3-3-2]
MSYAVAAEVTGPLVADLRPPNASATIESQTLALTSIESVTGTDEDDTLIGNAAANTLVGGDGDDLLRPGSGGGANDGGAGLDHVDWQDLTGVGVQFTIDGGVAQLGPTTTQATTNVEQVTGSPQADALTMSDTVLQTETLRGLDGDDVLSGRAGVDDIDGGPGNDTISGGIGQDVIDPGTGTDLVTYNDPERQVAAGPLTIDLRAGTFGGIQDIGGLPGGRDVVDVADTEIWEGGQTADSFRGIAGPQEFRGAAGDDLFLAGGSGTQRDAGDDRYQGDGGTDHVTWEGDRAVTADLVAGTATFADGEIDTLASVEDLTGSSGADVLRGDAQANNLFGAGGDDDLRGRGGTDSLDGGEGNDVVGGGAGQDLLFGGNPGFRIPGGTPGDTLDYSDETVGVSVDLQAENSPDQQISGFENVNGGSGNDALRGDAGLQPSGRQRRGRLDQRRCHRRYAVRRARGRTWQRHPRARP